MVFHEKKNHQSFSQKIDVLKKKAQNKHQFFNFKTSKAIIVINTKIVATEKVTLR